MILFCFTADTFITHASSSHLCRQGMAPVGTRQLRSQGLVFVHARRTEGVTGSGRWEGANGAASGIGGGNGAGNGGGGGNGDVKGDGDGARTGADRNEQTQDGNGNGNGDGDPRTNTR